MIDTFRTVPASELFATEIGISGAQLPTNGPGRKNPLIKYIFVGGIIIGAFILAYHLQNSAPPKIKKRENDE
ncbi:MAG: hypothetical protein FJZ66_00025 [Bacteroidetes bacterium]|nr:hypothetical protein [Bacteroidota bacterium]